MKWLGFRRSSEVEDYRDPTKPVIDEQAPSLSINDVLSLGRSQLAKDAGAESIKGAGMNAATAASGESARLVRAFVDSGALKIVVRLLMSASVWLYAKLTRK